MANGCAVAPFHLTSERTEEAENGIVSLTLVKRSEVNRQYAVSFTHLPSARLRLPDLERLRANCAIIVGGQLVAPRTKVTIDKCVSGQKALGLPGQFKSCRSSARLPDPVNVTMPFAVLAMSVVSLQINLFGKRSGC